MTGPVAVLNTLWARPNDCFIVSRICILKWKSPIRWQDHHLLFFLIDTTSASEEIYGYSEGKTAAIGPGKDYHINEPKG